MSKAASITRVTYRWGDRPGDEAGWYCQSFDPGGVNDDSRQVWFPVAVDTFGQFEGEDLVIALHDAFPAAEITAG